MEHETILEIITSFDDGRYDVVITPNVMSSIIQTYKNILIKQTASSDDLKFISICLPLLVIMEKLELLQQLQTTFDIDFGSTLLLNLAIFKQNIALINFLIKYVYQVEDFHMYEAISVKNLEIVKILSEYLYISDDIIYHNSVHGNQEIAKYFIDTGCVISKRSITATIEYPWRLDMLKFYIENGYVQENTLPGLLYFAITDCNMEATKYLLDKYKAMNCNFLNAAASNRCDDLEMFKYINNFFSKNHCTYCKLNNSVCNSCMDSKSMAMVAASEEGNIDIIEFLLKEGIDVNYQSGLALTSAASNNQIEAVEFLIENGADVRIDNSLALELACMNENIDIAEMLLDNGANPDTGKGRALRRACTNGHIDIVKLLVEAGANVRQEQNIAVFLAALHRHFDIVTYLLTKGASIQIIPCLPLDIIEAVKLYKKTTEPLQIYKGDISDEKDCAICLIELKNCTNTQCDTCKKITHLDCQNKWGRTCVYCRTIN